MLGHDILDEIISDDQPDIDEIILANLGGGGVPIVLRDTWMIWGGFSWMSHVQREFLPSSA